MNRGRTSSASKTTLANHQRHAHCSAVDLSPLPIAKSVSKNSKENSMAIDTVKTRRTKSREIAVDPSDFHHNSELLRQHEQSRRPALRGSQHSRTASRSAEDLQLFLHMDLNTIGRESTVYVDENCEPWSSHHLTQQGLPRPSLRSTGLDRSNEVLTKQNIELLLAGDGEVRSRGQRKTMMATGSSRTVDEKSLSTRRLHGSSSSGGGGSPAGGPLEKKTDMRTRPSENRYSKPCKTSSSNTKPTLISPLGILAYCSVTITRPSAPTLGFFSMHIP